MNVAQLIHKFRIEADDLVQPYLFRDEEVQAWLTEAQSEAAIRGRLLYEASNATISEIGVSAGVATYPLHRCLYELVHLQFKPVGSSTACVLSLQSREELDRIRPGWRDDTGNQPRYAIQDDTRITLVPRPSVAGVLSLEGYRVPLDALVNDVDEPELAEPHHHYLPFWALYRAFSRPDSETFAPEGAARSNAVFTGFFGPPVDSDLRRSTRVDEAHTTKAWWP